ncbi:MAG: hypothetical protein LBM96_11845 [Methanobrevibacter sp.]|jgi:hypothetical protein|nr:hypothetical protein [Candidatus Methanoflexus mossambicus]
MSEYKSISSKLTREDYTRFIDYCNRKGTKPSTLIRKMIQKELEEPFQRYVAGINNIEYNKRKDNFSWFARLDNGKKTAIIENIDLNFLINLNKEIEIAIENRNHLLDKKHKKSVAISSKLLKK